MIQVHLASNGNLLNWDTETGIGYLPANNVEPIYEIEYWNNYQKLKDTKMGRALTKARIELTTKYTSNPKSVLDIGIGNGQFVEEYGCWGTDVNPHAINWLNSIGKYSSTYDYEWMTLWDVVEHIEVDVLREIFSNNTKGVILSTPIYKSFNDVLQSKHYKPDEHIHYFSYHGIIKFMEKFNYKCVESSMIETKLGRESIGSFVFIKH